ncbi:uncharacterized protein YjbI with pentapeptide repeats [Bradyrhizobium sp. LM2.7]
MSIDLLLQSIAHGVPVREAEFDGQILSGLRLNDGVVVSSSFRKCNFTRAHLTGMTFQDCDFRDASFADARLEHCTFTSCRAGGSYWRRSRFGQSTCMLSDFGHSDFSDTTFAQTTAVRCVLAHAVLRGATLSQSAIMDCSLSNIVLDDARLMNAAITRADLRSAQFAGMRCDTIHFSECDLSERDLTGLPLVRANLSGAKLNHTNLCGADLSGSILNDASLMGADLSNATAPNTLFVRADLRAARLRSANLEHCVFVEARLDGCDLSGAKLDMAVFTRASAKSASFVAADMSYALMHHAKLSGSDFSGCRFLRTDFHCASTEGTIFAGLHNRPTDRAEPDKHHHLEYRRIWTGCHGKGLGEPWHRPPHPMRAVFEDLGRELGDESREAGGRFRKRSSRGATSDPTAHISGQGDQFGRPSPFFYRPTRMKHSQIYVVSRKGRHAVGTSYRQLFVTAGAGQAAAVIGWRSVGVAMTSIPLLNVPPRTTFGNWLWPSRRRQLFCAASSNLKTIASAVLLDRQPFDRMVRWRTWRRCFRSGW